MAAITYDPTLEQYVAEDAEGREVYGNTHTECALRLGEANRTIGKHNAKNPDDKPSMIVLEVKGYARGRHFIDRELVRVREAGKSYRDAKSSDFEAARDWLRSQGYEFDKVVGPNTKMGTGTAKYFYTLPPENHDDALPVDRPRRRDRLFKTRR